MKAAISTEDILDNELIELANALSQVLLILMLCQVSTNEIKVFNEDANKKVALINLVLRKIL